MLLHKIKRLLLIPLSWLATIVFLIEEAIWDWTARLMARLGLSSRAFSTSPDLR